MCNPAPSPTAAAPLAALLPDPASVFVGARLAISGTLLARDGLRASLSASEGLRLPLSYPYLAVPVSFVFAALFAFLRLKERVSRS